MKVKKILLFIILFFFCLVIKNNVNAYVVNEGGQGKYYLKDLPFEDSEESPAKSVFLLNSSVNEVYCIEVENYYKLGYDRLTKRLYKFDPTDYSTKTIFYYVCSLTVQDSLYIGGEWGYKSANNYLAIDNEKYTYIGGTTCFYPCVNISSGVFLIDNLIDGLSWNDDFALVKGTNEERIMLVVPTVQHKNSYFSKSGAYFKYFDSNNPSEAITLDAYYYDTSDFSFKFYKSNILSNFWPVQACYDYIFYCNKDILYNGDVLIKNTKNLFKGLYSYNHFPYILNGQEDLAKGEEDIIIMPRRFYKYRKDNI